jgi:hypothetical protein
MSFAMVSGSNRRRSGRSVVVAPPPPGQFDGPAELPRARSRWADALPSRFGVWPGNIWRLSSSATYAELKTAFYAACNAPDIDTRWVLLPTGTDLTPPPGESPLNPPRPVNPLFPVIVAHEEWFDGSVTYTYKRRVTPSQSAAQPILRGIKINAFASDAYPILLHTGTQDLIWVGLNLQDRAEGDVVQRALLSQGDNNQPTLDFIGPNVGGLAIWHCTFGLGTWFKSTDGTWKTGMRRAFEWNGSHCVLRDSRCTGIAGNPDGGVVSGWCGIGPFVIENNHLKDPGGIGILYGGSTRGAFYNIVPPVITAAPWRPGDFWIRYNDFDRTTGLSPFAVTRLRDSANNVSPYSFKNEIEPKNGERWLIEYNRFANDNDVAGGQNSVILLKSTNQDETPGGDGARDIVVRYNVVSSFKAPLGTSPIRDDSVNAGATTEGMVGVSVHDNLFVQDYSDTRYTAFPKYVMMQLGGWEIDAASASRDVANHAFRNNTLIRLGGVADDPAIVMIVGDTVTTKQFPGFAWDKSVISGGVTYDYFCTGPAGSGFGLDVVHARGASAPVWFPDLELGVNARVDCVNLGDPPSPAQLTYPSLASVNLTMGATADQWTLGAGSPLRTAGPGGTLMGADIDTIMIARAAVLAGEQP